ncbi:MAG: hypothetical protein KDB23_23065, partial [Planctomycetales bacterium]|nr:hypothetical protein [Planctomycetales bacterium]
QGDEATQTVNVSYAGRTDWQIVDVRSANQNLIVEPTEMQRANGRVDYQLKVHLRPDAPSGYFNDQMVLVTNDYQQQQIPLRVEGHVVAPLSVSPSALNLGVIQPGQSITRKLVVKGKKPFRVTDIKCGDANFAFEPTDEEKALHIIPITFTAGDEPAQISQEITVETDLNGGSTGAVLATATVRDLES